MDADASMCRDGPLPAVPPSKLPKSPDNAAACGCRDVPCGRCVRTSRHNSLGTVKVYIFCSRYAHIAVILCYTIFAATSYHGNLTAAREVRLVVENLLASFVVGVVSSFIAAWLYDKTRNSGNR